MMNFRKRLSIQVEDTHEDEEDIQLAQLQDETKSMKLFDSADNKNKFSDGNKHKIIELNNSYVNQLLTYMEGENSSSDLSYNWLNRVHNVKILSKSIHVNSERSTDKTIKMRDFACEFKLIKLLTEDTKHKESLLKLKRTLVRNNRYNDILPYNHNVALIGDEITGANNITDINFDDVYINASYIDGPLQDDFKFFIATQGPLNSTISKFWKLIFTRQVKLIVMLCNLEEDSRKKCECYWPSKGTVKSFDEIEVYLEKEEYVIKESLIKREFIIRISGVEKRVTALQMINWPDHNSPNEDTGYKTIEYILSTINEIKSNFPNSPILTHCSAGTGRTGVLIAIYNLTRSFNIIKYINLGIDNIQNKIKPFMSVFNTVRKLREQRMGMVSSYAQYKYIYDFAFEFIRRNFECATALASASVSASVSASATEENFIM